MLGVCCLAVQIMTLDLISDQYLDYPPPGFLCQKINATNNQLSNPGGIFPGIRGGGGCLAAQILTLDIISDEYP